MSNLLKTLKTFTGKNASGILTGIGVGLGLSSTISMVPATVKAVKKVQQKETDYGRKLSKKEVVKEVWTEYIPAATGSVIAASCIVGGYSKHCKELTAVATAYKITETTLRDYKAAVAEEVGQDVAKAIDSRAAQKQSESGIERNGGSIMVCGTSGGNNVLFQDSLSGRCFYTTMNNVENSRNILNDKLNTQDYISVNEWYNILNIDNLVATDTGDRLGWNRTKGLVTFRYNPVMIGCEPGAIIEFSVAPQYDYSKMN